MKCFKTWYKHWEYTEYEVEKKKFSNFFFFRGPGLEKIGKKSEFFAIFCIFFTKKSIKQTNISMKVDNIVEHINIEKLFICTWLN